MFNSLFALISVIIEKVSMGISYNFKRVNCCDGTLCSGCEFSPLSSCV